LRAREPSATDPSSTQKRKRRGTALAQTNRKSGTSVFRAKVRGEELERSHSKRAEKELSRITEETGKKGPKLPEESQTLERH